MKKLSITEVLLAYDGPLVVVAEDGKTDKAYLGINYGDGENAYLFYFAKVTQAHLQLLFEQRIDVRYLVTKYRQGDYLSSECWGRVGNIVETKALKNFDISWLPESGMFIPHEISASASVKLKTVHIDGRWGIEDLRKFSDLVQDAYAFVFALTGAGATSTRQRMEALFRKYPWRGGFSSVNFFDDLYRLIPASERAQIRRIQYASPGTIELKMDDGVANSIRGFVTSLNEPDSVSSKEYTEVRATLKKRGWLGKAKDDLHLTPQDEAMLLQFVSRLAKEFGLQGSADEIVSLANSDPLGAVKILLAYYRRLAGLADYVATGKAQELFV
jgi:hypothetical protein